MTTRILISAAMLASFAMLPAVGEAQQDAPRPPVRTFDGASPPGSPPQAPNVTSAPQAAPRAPSAPQAAPKPSSASPQAGPKPPSTPQAAPAGDAADKPPVDDATRKRQAALERAKERKREQEEREAQCVIKPVMSDEDI